MRSKPTLGSVQARRALQPVAPVVPINPGDPAQAAREETFARLAELVRKRDPIPADVFASARFSFQLRSVDDELAALVYDSIVDDDLLAGVRSGGLATRQLTFAARELVIEVEISGGSERAVTGQVVPPQAAEVELRHRTGSTEAATDELGFFQYSALPDGPVSFRCRPTRDGADAVATSWVTL